MLRKIWALVKGLMVEQGLVEPLWCEPLLTFAETKPPPKGIDKDVVAPTKELRTLIERTRRASGLDSSAVVDRLEKKYKDMVFLPNDSSGPNRIKADVLRYMGPHASPSGKPSRRSASI